MNTAPCARCGTCLAPAPETASGSGFCPRCVLGCVLDSESESPADAEMFGGYELRRRIGEGGYGEVWKAWDGRLGRFVALKRLKGVAAGDRKRLLTEATLAARLSHPHIAPVHEVGEDGGEPFLAMKLVQGMTLRELVEREEEARDSRVIAALIRDTARGVAAAHERGIFHCDLKPENLLAERRAEDSGWHVYVTDFGLARAAGEGAAATLSGVAGTPAFMAPEQVQGSRVDARTDVYALGATLYALLTRRPPFLGATPAEVLHAVAGAEPVPPRRVAASIDRDLETITLKCLEKEPARRYGSAHDLADDLDRWLDSRPVRARRPSLLYVAGKALRRRRATAWTAAAGAAVLATALAWFVPRVMRAERSAELWTQVSVILADADALARAGENARATARLDQGIALCENSLAGGDLPHAHYFLGRLRRARGDRSGARAALDRALAADPGLGEARFERGLLSVEEYTDELSSALEILGARVGTGDYRDPALADRAEALVPSLLPLRTAALADLSPTLGRSLYFRPADALFGQAEFHRLQRDFPSARKKLEEVLHADPLHVGALLSLSRIRWRPEENFDEAWRLANRAVEVHRGHGAAYAWRSSLALEGGRVKAFTEEQKKLFAQSVEDADKAIRLGAATAGAYARRAAARNDSGDLAEALADYDEAIRLNPAFSMAWNGRGSVHLAAGRFEEAVRDYDAALERDPENPWAFFNRGLAYRELKRHADAERDFTAVMQLQPAWVEPIYERGESRRLSGNADGALADFDAALKKSPVEWQAFRGRALVRLSLGEKEKAVGDFREGLRVMRAGDPARAALEKLLEDAIR